MVLAVKNQIFINFSFDFKNKIKNVRLIFVIKNKLKTNFNMRKTVFFLAFMAFFTLTISAQNSNSNVSVGDTFIIAEVDNDNYKHINFPKANIVNKRGGVVNYDLLVGKKVEITQIKEKKDGTKVATIKLTSGKRFFKSHKFITVDISEAILSGELKS